MLNESPGSFYQRTIHTGNIGTLAFDYLHSYVDESLKLPGVSTLEGIDYNFT
ncbi:hypothetical protein [Bacterioplanoides pacificum]|uniref:Uncharacterized protein n=1 Tax=Bacterioplanoides pacificum TaxID=1171596 RepID=A0ABV7VQY0_9GAMM